MTWELWVLAAAVVFVIYARLTDKCKKCGSIKGFTTVSGGNWSGTWSFRRCKKCGEKE